MRKPLMKILSFLLGAHFTLAFYDDGLWEDSTWLDYYRSELVKVNCDDPAIRVEVDQQIINFQNNNPSFFRTKAENSCSPSYLSSGRISYAALKLQTEQNICFERRVKQLRPTWCSQLSQQTTCSSLSEDPCYLDGGIERMKRSYCGIRRDMYGPSNIDYIVIRYHEQARCEDLGNAVKTAFDTFLDNPADYIEKELSVETTLENSKIWPFCIDSYYAGLNVETELRCNRRVTAAERQTMQQYNSYWNDPNASTAIEEAKQQLKNSAIAANDARKYLCLAQYDSPRLQVGNWYNPGPVNDYVIGAKLQMKWSNDRVNAEQARVTMQYIENGNFRNLEMGPVSEGVPASTYTERLYAYQKKMDGACKGLYDKYDTASTFCSPYSNQLSQLYQGLDKTEEIMLKENNYNVRFALCMMRTMADKMSLDTNSRVQEFCLKLRRFVRDRYIDTIYQNPDCSGASQAAGVNINNLGSAIVNRQYETIRQLNRSMHGMDRYTKASFDTCLTENILSSLSRTCTSGQHAARTNNIRTFVQQTMANPNLSVRERDVAITGKLMEGPYQGAASAMCDQFAIIEDSANPNQKRERIQLMKKYIFPTVKDLKRYEDLVNLQPMHECYNTGMLVDLQEDYIDDSGFWYMDPGYGYDTPEACKTNRTIDKRQACRKNRVCEIINQAPDHTCYGMTNLRTTIDNEWQKIMNAARNVNFNFFTELKNMASTIANNFLTSSPNVLLFGPRDIIRPSDSWKCAIKLMAKKIQAYRNPINECYIQHSLTEYPLLPANYPPDFLGNPQPNTGTPAVWPFNDYGPSAPLRPSNANRASVPVWPFSNEGPSAPVGRSKSA